MRAGGEGAEAEVVRFLIQVWERYTVLHLIFVQDMEALAELLATLVGGFTTKLDAEEVHR